MHAPGMDNQQVAMEADELDMLMSDVPTQQARVDLNLQAKIDAEQARYDQLLADFEAKLKIGAPEPPAADIEAEAEAFLKRVKDQDRSLAEMEKQTLVHLEASHLFNMFATADEGKKDELRKVSLADLKLKLPSIKESSSLLKNILKKMDDLPQDQQTRMIDSLNHKFS